MFYEAGQHEALQQLNLVKTAKVAPLLVRRRKDPYQEIYRRINRAFKLKMPKFDMSKLLARMLRSPYIQPRKHLSGKGPVLKM